MKYFLLSLLLIALMAGCQDHKVEWMDQDYSVNYSTCTVFVFWNPGNRGYWIERQSERIKKINAAYDDLEKSRTWFAQLKRRIIDVL